MDRSRTKLVCTIGPASAERIGDLVAAGMDVARINFSHGTPDEHKAYVHAVRAAAHSARRSVAVMADLPGPKIRLGELEDGAITLATGATFTLRPSRSAEVAVIEIPAAPPETVEIKPDGYETPEGTEATIEATDVEDAPLAEQEDDSALPVAEEVVAPDASDLVDAPSARDDVDDTAGSAMAVSEPSRPPEALGDASGASVSTTTLAAQLQISDRILLADGAAELRVTAISGTDVVTEVVHGGQVRTRSGVNIPSIRLTGDGLTDGDRAAVPRALELRVDLIAQSFVRSADDVRSLRQMLPADGPRVVAKIETQAAVDAFDEIAQVADGIMVARGDLGVDIPFEAVPLVQKDLIRRATRAGRFSIVATQMLESMTSAPRPTRAEASDVANAVLDGADAVMLSAETAIGQFPIESLQAMARICWSTETDGGDLMRGAEAPTGGSPADEVIAGATYMALRYASKDAAALWCFTRSGVTAELLSLQRPGIPIIAFTLSPIVARRLAVRSGVIPMVLPAAGARDEPLISRMETAWRGQKERTSFDTVVLVTTSRRAGGVNRVEIHRLSGQAATG